MRNVFFDGVYECVHALRGIIYIAIMTEMINLLCVAAPGLTKSVGNSVY